MSYNVYWQAENGLWYYRTHSLVSHMACTLAKAVYDEGKHVVCVQYATGDIKCPVSVLPGKTILEINVRT